MDEFFPKNAVPGARQGAQVRAFRLSKYVRCTLFTCGRDLLFLESVPFFFLTSLCGCAWSLAALAHPEGQVAPSELSSLDRWVDMSWPNST